MGHSLTKKHAEELAIDADAHVGVQHSASASQAKLLGNDDFTPQ